MATLNVHVSTSASDGYQVNIGGGANFTTTSLDNLNVGNYWATRFLSTTIPKDAVIVSATVSIDVYTTKYPTIDTVLWGEAANNSAAITTATNNITNRTKTSASTTWQQTVSATGFVTSPDISAQVQEIVNRASWASGNALTILWYNDLAGNVTISSWDNANTNEPYLDVTYYVGQVIFSTGIASTTTMGAPTLTRGAVAISPTSIASTTTIGTASVAIANVAMPTGLTSTTTMGAPTLTPGAVAINVASISATTVLGTVTLSVITTQTVSATSVGSTTTFGTTAVTVAVDVDLTPIAIGMRERSAAVYELSAQQVREKGIQVFQ